VDIVVCVKPVLDPDLPPAKFMVDERENQVVSPEGMPLVVNPYDALAVEAAIRIKEQKPGKVTGLTVGDRSSEPVLRKALAMGADEAVILSDPAFAGSDGFGVASILAAAIRKIGACDLVLCGRQASDWDVGMVGLALSEYLNIPAVTRAKSVTVLDGRLSVERAVMNGFETFETTLPAVVSISNEFGKARIPTGRGIIFAARKPIPAWDAAALGISRSVVGKAAARNRLVRLYRPSNERKCEMIVRENVADAAAALARKLVEIR
jgi:electron transfer flavoprotein beta subunit